MDLDSRKTLYLIDGSSYIYRAFYAVARLVSSRGMPTNAVYGFSQMLQKVLKEKKPDCLCVVFDAPGPTFRHEEYEAYKGTRQKMPEDLVVQVPYIKDLVRFHGIPQMEREGYEADDIIATLARLAGEEGLGVVIVSGDKDLCQLVKDPDVIQWDPQKDRVFTEETVAERFGVTPSQLLDYLAIVGDSSDNVPGVKGVGEKTALQLIKDWGSLDGVFAHLDDIPRAAVRKKLADGRESAYLSRRLITLVDSVPMEGGIETLVKRMPPSLPDLMRLFEELEFKSLLDAVREELSETGAAPPAGPSLPSREDRIVGDRDALVELIPFLKEAACLSLDLETTTADAMRAELRGLALSWKDGGACYIPLGRGGAEGAGRLDEAEALDALKPVLAGAEPGKASRDLKYAWVLLKRRGIELRGMAFDAMVGSYLLDSGGRTHDLDRVASEHLGEKLTSLEEAAGSGKTRADLSAVSAPHAPDFACRNAEAVFRLVPVLKRKLRESNLQDLYENLEMPLIGVLAEMEHRGILVDAGKLEALSADFEKAMDGKAAVIYDLAKEEFNIQSPKQLAGILFDKLGLRVVKKTKSGPSTDVSVLEELAAEHPITECVLGYRTLAKLKGTYADALPRLIHPQTGRIHTSYNQAVTATGRLSSSDPNLQNIPIRTEEGRKIRRAFVPGEGKVLLSADYSQIELRILAHYSRDERLLEAFLSGGDIHQRTAAEMYGIPPLEVTPEMRRQAKTVNFGIIYGMGPFGLARRLRISQKMAKAAIEQYFERYRGVKRFIGEIILKARELGYSETLLGRRRAIPELHSRNFTVRQQGERLAVNTPIQGTAADLIKKAMIDIDRALKESGLGAVMLLQVHDELVFEVPIEEIDAARKLIERGMENVWDLAAPLRVDAGWGADWAEAHP